MSDLTILKLHLNERMKTIINFNVFNKPPGKNKFRITGIPLIYFVFS